MEIIKNGDLSKLEQYEQFECPHCGCIFLATHSEYVVGFFRNELSYCIHCPTCKRSVIKTKDR